MSATEAYFVSRSMQALEVLAFGPSTASRIAAELQVHPRTARRLLNRMVHDGWLVRRDGPRPTYTPTMRIVALAAQFAQRAPLVRHGVTVARELQAAEGGAVHLAVPSYRSALRLVRAAGEGKTERRDLAPAHATAAGKLLLAFREPWREVVLDAPLEPVTERTLIDPGAVRRDVAAARERGYAKEDGEFRPGTRAIAVPVRDGSGDVIAALALSSLPEPAAARDALVAAADALSSRLVREAA
jgi:DNA-binding IclR family transcriptional regulator